MPEWQVRPAALADENALLDSALDAYRDIYRLMFADDPGVNHGLPIEARSFRRGEGWSVLLLLTPWMLARLWFPEADPKLPVPAGWQAAERATAEPVLLGPGVDFVFLEAPQKAHLGHHPALGHYLIQPLILSMLKFTAADQAFAAWDEVIRTRDANMARASRDCPLQKEVSRHELLGRLFRRRPI